MTVQGGNEAQISTVNAKALSSALSRLRLVRLRLSEATSLLNDDASLDVIDWATAQLWKASEELTQRGDTPANEF